MRVVELSHPIVSGMPQHFEGPVPSRFDLSVRTGATFQAVDDASALPHHLGTHVDAPRHYDPASQEGVEAIPLSRLLTPAVVIDLRVTRVPGEISAADLEQGLRAAGETLVPGDALLVDTGLAAAYDDWTADGWADYGDYPAWTADAALLVRDAGVSCVGVDALSLDRGRDARPGHELLLRDAKIPILENLRNLDRLRRRRVLLIATPVKLVGATGFPVRALAVEDVDLGAWRSFEVVD